MNVNTPIIPVTDFVRNFASHMALLPRVQEIILTRDSRPVATLKATPEEKNRELLKFLKTIDGKLWKNDKVWKAVAVRRNRKEPIRL
ncbi:MAG: hypothetical protein AAB506_01560 [Patescibacteria group bacterium]|mgnify:FL=1